MQLTCYSNNTFPGIFQHTVFQHTVFQQRGLTISSTFQYTNVLVFPCYERDRERYSQRHVLKHKPLEGELPKCKGCPIRWPGAWHTVHGPPTSKPLFFTEYQGYSRPVFIFIHVNDCKCIDILWYTYITLDDMTRHDMTTHTHTHIHTHTYIYI